MNICTELGSHQVCRYLVPIATMSLSVYCQLLLLSITDSIRDKEGRTRSWHVYGAYFSEYFALLGLLIILTQRLNYDTCHKFRYLT